MAMSDSSSISSNSSTNASPFNFNAWIEKNGLTEVKPIFIKHKMFSLSLLSIPMTSNKFNTKFIGSLATENPEYFDKVMRALERLNTATNNKKIIKKIRGTDEEFAVEELIQNKINQLTNLQDNIQKLHDKYTKQTEITHTNIATIKSEIEHKFNEITVETERHKTNISNELIEFKVRLDFENKMEILNKLLNKIESEIQYENKQLSHISQLLEDNTMQREARKHEILKIGQNIETLSSYNHYKKILNENNLYDVSHNNIEIIVHEKAKEKICKYLGKYVTLKYDRDNSYVNMNVNEIKEDDNESCVSGIHNNKVNMAKKNKQIEDLNEIISLKDSIIGSVKKELTKQENELNEFTHNYSKKISIKENIIESLRTQLHNKEGEFNKEKDLLNQEIISKKKQCKIINEKYDTLRINNEDMVRNNNEWIRKYEQLNKMVSANDNLMKINHEKYQQTFDEYKNNEISLKQMVNHKQIKIDDLMDKQTYMENKLNEKRKKIEKREHKIQKLEDQIIALNTNTNMNQFETDEGQNWAEQISKWAEENDKLCRDMKMCYRQISELQNKVKSKDCTINTKEKIIKTKENEINVLRNKVNDQRNELSKCVVNANNNKNKINKINKNNMNHKNIGIMNNNNKKKKLKVNPNVKQMNGNVNKYAMIVQNHQNKINRKILSDMRRFNGNNGKQFVEEFCCKSQCGRVNYETFHISKNNGTQVWLCKMQIIKIGLSEQYESKQKKVAIHQCYQKLAQSIWKKK